VDRIVAEALALEVSHGTHPTARWHHLSSPGIGHAPSCDCSGFGCRTRERTSFSLAQAFHAWDEGTTIPLFPFSM
jgi:hypothetical protein